MKNPIPKAKFESSLYIGGKWYRMRVKDEKIDKSDLIKMLDCQILTDEILTPVLGISDLRSDERIDFIGGIRGLKEIEKRCKEDCVAGIAMYPV